MNCFQGGDTAVQADRFRPLLRNPAPFGTEFRRRNPETAGRRWRPRLPSRPVPRPSQPVSTLFLRGKHDRQAPARPPAGRSRHPPQQRAERPGAAAISPRPRRLSLARPGRRPPRWAARTCSSRSTPASSASSIMLTAECVLDAVSCKEVVKHYRFVLYFYVRKETKIELKKQSSCCVHLVNKSDQYVAFKAKTTSPKRYCVRPNVGVILPLASCDFTVTMQAVKNAPPDLQIKDKFLVQTTVVPFGTADEDIVPAFFSKETDRYIEEKKLKVVLVSMAQPQVEQPTNGLSHAKETVGIPVTEEILDNVNEAPVVVNEVFHPLNESAPNLQETSATSVESQFASTETSADLKSSPLEYTPAPSEVPSLSDIESTNTDNIHISHVTEDVHTLQMKLNNLGVKLEEAETLILNLMAETRGTIQERDKLRKEMVFLKRAGASQGQSSTGFPLLFVVYMAVVGMSLGYLLHL